MTRSTTLVLGAVGTLAGALLLYPYAVLVTRLVHIHHDGNVHLHWFDLAPTVATLFVGRMLPLAIPFSLVGMGLGVLLGVAINRTRRLFAVEHEARAQERANLEMERFVVEVAHHVLNANMVIASRARICCDSTSREVVEHLTVILEESAAIDAVVRSLRESAQRHQVAKEWSGNGRPRT